MEKLDWGDRDLNAVEEWKAVINKRLNQADDNLLLISVYFGLQIIVINMKINEM